MTGAPGAPPSEKAALSRELADFLIELSIALHKHSMYPEGHPSLAPAAAGVTRRAEHLFEDRTTLALGVARQQLVIEGVATDPKNPLLAELAGRLHRHHLGAVTFQRGLRVSEVLDVLKTLSVEAERTGQPLGLGAPEQLRAWDHVRLYPVTYERLELLEEPADAPASPDDKAAKERGLRGSQLWLGLARAALAVDATAQADAPPPPTEPAAIAKAIDEHQHSAAYDQVIVGYLLQIADELKHAGGAEAVSLRRRTSKLVGALHPGTLRRLIQMGGDNAQRAKFAIDATHGLAVDAVLDIVRAMAEASHKTVSDPLVRMLSKLAQHAEQGPLEARPQADEALRDQVRELLRGWTIDDPNPDGYGDALQKMAAAALPAAQRQETRQEAEPLRIVQTALETGALGFGAWRAIERLVAEHHVPDLVGLLGTTPSRTDIASLWTRVTSPDVVRQLAAAEPPDFITLDRVLPRLQVDAFEPLLDVLGASESRTTRRGLLDRLTRAPRELGPVIASRLGRDIPWYVTRNLLVILDGLPALPDGFSTAAYIAHEDARVRREALKVSLKVPAERERALIGALRDDDPRTVRLALAAASDDCPASVMPLITQIVLDQSMSSELRVLAIKVLGRVRSTAALNALLQLVDGGTNWMGRRKLAPRSLELLAALLALAAGWRNDVKAAALLALAQASSDPEIRNAASATPRTTTAVKR